MRVEKKSSFNFQGLVVPHGVAKPYVPRAWWWAWITVVWWTNSVDKTIHVLLLLLDNCWFHDSQSFQKSMIVFVATKKKQGTSSSSTLVTVTNSLINAVRVDCGDQMIWYPVLQHYLPTGYSCSSIKNTRELRWPANSEWTIRRDLAWINYKSHTHRTQKVRGIDRQKKEKSRTVTRKLAERTTPARLIDLADPSVSHSVRPSHRWLLPDPFLRTHKPPLLACPPYTPMAQCLSCRM